MAEIEWKGIVLIGAIMMAAFGLLKLLEKKTKIRGELKRKTFHITMGLMVLSFPYVFHNRYSVVVVGILCFILFMVMRHSKLKDTMGSVLYSVDRESLGEIFFTISVVLIFYWSKGDKILYSIPILLLTFADSVAALIGKNYGKNSISELNEDKKSIEGSFMFFMVAFLLTHIPLLLFTNVGREETLIISAIVGFNVALIEMISHTGNDNLLIPLTTYAFLYTHMSLDVEELRVHLLILGIIFILVSIVNRVKAWSKMALIEALVVGYLTVTLYGLYALIPPLLLFFSTMRFPKMKEEEKGNTYDARIIETNVLVPIAICGIATVLKLRQELFLAYSLAYAMHLTVNTFVRLKYYFKMKNSDSIIFAFLKGLTFVYVPSLITSKIVFGTIGIPLYMVYIEIALLFISAIKIYLRKKNVETEEISIKNGYMHMKIVASLTSVLLIIEFIRTTFFIA